MKIQNTTKTLQATNANLSQSEFDDVNLEDATFTNVNLSKATFTDINFSGAKFSNLNLTDVEIDACETTGMKFCGVLVSELLMPTNKKPNRGAAVNRRPAGPSTIRTIVSDLCHDFESHLDKPISEGASFGQTSRPEQAPLLINEIAPEAVERMAHGMPAFGDICAFASQKHYMALYVCDDDIWASHRSKLGKLDCGKCCIRFKRLEDLPLDVVEQILNDVLQIRRGAAVGA